MINQLASIIGVFFKIFETRLSLLAFELHEEKLKLFKILVLVSCCLIFLNFGLMSLMILIMWAIEPERRIFVLYMTTGLLFFISLIVGLLATRSLKKSSFLKRTREQVRLDIDILRGDD